MAKNKNEARQEFQYELAGQTALTQEVLKQQPEYQQMNPSDRPEHEPHRRLTMVLAEHGFRLRQLLTHMGPIALLQKGLNEIKQRNTERRQDQDEALIAVEVLNHGSLTPAQLPAWAAPTPDDTAVVDNAYQFTAMMLGTGSDGLGVPAVTKYMVVTANPSQAASINGRMVIQAAARGDDQVGIVIDGPTRQQIAGETFFEFVIAGADSIVEDFPVSGIVGEAGGSSVVQAGDILYASKDSNGAVEELNTLTSGQVCPVCRVRKVNNLAAPTKATVQVLSRGPFAFTHP